MQVKELIKELQSLPQNIEIVVIAQNNLQFPPNPRRVLKNKMDVLNLSDENTERIVLHWE